VHGLDVFHPSSTATLKQQSQWPLVFIVSTPHDPFPHIRTAVMAPSPALFPPADGGHHTWPAPNYINPEQRGWGAPAGIIAMCVVTFGVVAARLWARFCIKRTPGVDDWLIIASMVCLP
jgi:hypothetical protein